MVAGVAPVPSHPLRGCSLNGPSPQWLGLGVLFGRLSVGSNRVVRSGRLTPAADCRFWICVGEKIRRTPDQVGYAAATPSYLEKNSKAQWLRFVISRAATASATPAVRPGPRAPGRSSRGGRAPAGGV